ncbi:TPA: IpaD/SipD/SspD family type III secretion system needle tip protein [Yersinia enterocolitica]|nr:IpaD/SipD/SspD family type III secretion system needle tip protein [Yersinia enterocolitica]
MEIDISSTQYVEKSRHSMGFLMADNPSKALPMERQEAKLPAYIVDQPESEPYVWAQQTIETYADNFKLPEQYAPLVSSTLLEDVEQEQRTLSRVAQSNSDAYGAAKKEFIDEMQKAEINVLSRSKNDQGTPAHIQSLEKMIDNIHNNYQKTYAEINQKAAEYMKDVNTAVGKISDFIKPGSDGKIKLHAYNYLDGMRETLEKYTGFDTASDNPHFTNWANGNNPSLPIHTFSGDEDAINFWQKKLGDGFIVQRGSSGQIEISPDLKPIRNIFNSVIEVANNNGSKTAWGDVSMQSQTFQSLQAAIDSQKNAVNSSVSQLLERFRQDNSTFETFIQLLVQMTKDLHQYNAGYYQ